jgi:hypothetical protein
MGVEAKELPKNASAKAHQQEGGDQDQADRRPTFRALYPNIETPSAASASRRADKAKPSVPGQKMVLRGLVLLQLLNASTTAKAICPATGW